jgi:hypothetical protein
MISKKNTSVKDPWLVFVRQPWTNQEGVWTGWFVTAQYRTQQKAQEEAAGFESYGYGQACVIHIRDEKIVQDLISHGRKRDAEIAAELRR